MSESQTRAKESGLMPRINQVKALRDARTGDTADLLATVVSGHLAHLWEHGGKVGADRGGQHPEWIYLRWPFVATKTSDHRGPVLPQLIKSRGLQLRLELLLLFDAQCRHAPGQEAQNVRWISPRADYKYVSWRQLVLTATEPTTGTGRGAGDLRARQITEALCALEEHHLVSIPREVGGKRRRYKDFRLLSEIGSPEGFRYTVPHDAPVFALSRNFFTNLWVFALTDIELATFLALSWLRWKFPGRHTTDGVFVTAEYREKLFRLTRSTWRSTNLLHRFGLIDCMPDAGRIYGTGKINGEFKKRWANREVKPVRFQINDQALEQPALETIYRILAEPTNDDRLRNRDLRERLVFG